ncbi:hydrogenase nickel incorporation protein HybF [Photobacterium jeanii]|uniref:Hydrogenase maturation factor HypA n=1 Tax=Photobacterium jeanii TaxID=858640 RepID=A0A178K2Y0_9GAMM|nr:hydrogenase maturation nickel metallochaperone HypA [Photobacterium jeanii]OAN11305.1 hydrogenase nickel incorporation protein HybF [Photobacterium jeanii]PST90826.1 hydrogenase maturation nickel metallochaperone HypA [Photobacterium jeanii]
MHEMSLSMETVDLIAAQTRQKGFNKVTKVWLEIGVLSCVEPDTIAFCFDLAAKETLVEGAELEIVSKEGKALCYDCDQTVALAKRGDSCPLCQGYKLKVLQGDEMRIKEIEVE